MLTDLHIWNLALIEKASARFASGLNVISGETGAGKSLLLQALSLVLGSRAQADRVREGAAAALVEARFELEGELQTCIQRRLDELGLPVAGDELIIRRRISKDGKSRVYINDASATVRALQQVTAGLVELTGQHAQIGLMRSDRQRELVDEFGRIGDVRVSAGRAVNALRDAQATLAQLHASAANRAERQEFLRFYRQEYERVAPQSGELAELENEAERLRHHERLREGVTASVSNLYERQNSALDLVSEAVATLESLTQIDAQLSDSVSNLYEVQAVIDDVTRALRQYLSDGLGDPERLDELDTRIHQLQRLCRKHNTDLDGVIDKMEKARIELEGLDALDDHLEGAEHALNTAETKARAALASLTAARAATLMPLVEAVHTHLGDLGFLKAEFSVKHEVMDDLSAITEHGADRLHFILSANPGQPLKPLAKVASGGELSRLLLAMKCALAEVDTVALHVLDEVDTGIGGPTGEIVGRKIRELADSAQVLCVTHLPQIACFADNHLLVKKRVAGDGTVTLVEALSASGREGEVARMLGGEEITPTTIEHAREMIHRAHRARALH